MDKKPADYSLDTSKLPERLNELINLIGLPETLKLLESKGGSACYIPKSVKPHCPLLKIISFESIAKLSAEYCGESIDLPKADHINRQIRDREIIRKSILGASRNELVNQYNLSRRQIGNIRRSQRARLQATEGTHD